jgi:catechol 2,3-dioxygenase-like lactoylglutathione lyase family enzyme
MLKDSTAIATVAVKDIAAARAFYERTLGLTPVDESEPGVITFRSGGSSLLVYESQFAGSNQATAVTWIVGDVRGSVKALEEKGVAFEHYDMPDTTREGHVHVSGRIEVAWFKDPDGNIHALVNQ